MITQGDITYFVDQLRSKSVGDEDIFARSARFIQALAAERTATGAEEPEFGWKDVADNQRQVLEDLLTSIGVDEARGADFTELANLLEVTLRSAVPAPDKAPEPSGAEEMREHCIDCDGEGRYPSGATCESCGGAGWVGPGDGIPRPSTGGTDGKSAEEIAEQIVSEHVTVTEHRNWVEDYDALVYAIAAAVRRPQAFAEVRAVKSANQFAREFLERWWVLNLPNIDPDDELPHWAKMVASAIREDRNSRAATEARVGELEGLLRRSKAVLQDYVVDAEEWTVLVDLVNDIEATLPDPPSIPTPPARGGRDG